MPLFLGHTISFQLPLRSLVLLVMMPSMMSLPAASSGTRTYKRPMHACLRLLIQRISVAMYQARKCSSVTRDYHSQLKIFWDFCFFGLFSGLFLPFLVDKLVFALLAPQYAMLYTKNVRMIKWNIHEESPAGLWPSQ